MERGQKKMEQSKEQLRAAAEELLSRSSGGIAAIHSNDELLHELQVHQIELEMQNEELRQAHLSLEESRDCYMDLYDFAPVGYLTLSREGMIEEVNHTGAQLFGGNRQQLLHHRFSSLVTLEDRDRWYRHFLYTLRHDGKQSCELALTREDRTVFHALLHCLHVSTGTSPVVRIALTDISESKKASEELRIASIAFESQEAIIVTDAKGVILRVNQSFTHLTGYSREEIVGKTPMMLQSGRHDKSFFHRQRIVLRETSFWQGEMWNRRKDGKVYAEWVTISAVIDTDGHTTHYVHTFSDITRNREAEAEIHRLAYYDALTQLPNRRMLLDRMDQALSGSSRNGTYGAILFLDLDNFKTLNDTRGHDVGDQLLVIVAQRLHNTLREGDTISRIGSTVSRLGGDEFVVVLEDLSTKPVEAAVQARQVAEKLHEALSQTYILASGELFCTTSIGITLFYRHALKVDTLLKQADLALYQAKKSGGNTLQFFDPEMQAAIDQRNVQELCLSQALDRGQFQFYYQAQTDSDQRIIAAEALLRWEDPDLGLKTPCDFISLAEETGLSLPIGRWVLESACAQIKSWAEKPVSRHLRLSINISLSQFRHPGFVAELKTVLAQTGADPTRLKVDLSEGLALKNMEKAINIIQNLKSLGVGVSLDAFGAGLSSLASLRQLPVDQLKIDGALVRKTTTDPKDATIVSAIIAMGKALGLKIHSLGVETSEQMDFLKKHGCDTYQGHLISHPLPIDEFNQFLALSTAQKGIHGETH